MAGWIRLRGDLNDIKVIRKSGDEWVTESVNLTDDVRPDDIIKVEERWF